MKICFLDKTDFSYTFKDKYSAKLRGAENILINLSKTLSNLGNEVFVFNNCDKEFHETNYQWNNLNRTNNKVFSFDIAIANGDARLLNNVTANKKFVISHSLQSIEKFIRKKQLFAYIKNKPTYLLLGKYHEKNRSKILSLFGTKILNYAVDEIFLNENISSSINSRQSIFTSRQDRNLDILINIWKSNIYPLMKDAKLLITPKNDVSLTKYGIIDRKMHTQQHLINDLKNSRLMLVPGHKSELYCLAAEEARELCIPIITLGIGSLSERVQDGITGFIAKNNNQFSEYVIELYSNEKLFNELRNNLINMRGKYTWRVAAKNFMKDL